MLALLFVVGCGDPSTAPDGGQDVPATPDDTVIGDSPGEIVAPVLSGLTLEPNPICDLSCVVRWSTDVPASSWVEVGTDDTPTSRIGDDAAVTDHEVIVVGLAPETTYALTAVSAAGAGPNTRSAPQEFTTGGAAPPWITGIVDIHDPDKAWAGWTLANVLTDVAADEPLVLVLLDMDGRPVWYFEGEMGSGRGDVEVSFVDGRNVLVGGGFSEGVRPFLMDLKGEILWEGPEQPGGDGPVPNLLVEGTMHHAFHRMDDGTFVVIENTIVDGIIGDRIRHFDANLDTLWLWNAFDHLPNPHVASLGQWLHTNGVIIEPAAGTALINCMALEQLFKVSYPDGDVLWTLGKDGDFAPAPHAEHPWFFGGHGFEHLSDGNLLLYDNGTIDRGFSRAVEYALDEEAMTATIAWEYPGGFADDHWFNGAMGDADTLPNGNVFITAGNGVQNQSPSRLMEVTRAGEKVWQMWWRNEEDGRSGCYQAERIPALLQPL